jgi:hypothetical protein
MNLNHTHKKSKHEEEDKPHSHILAPYEFVSTLGLIHKHLHPAPNATHPALPAKQKPFINLTHQPTSRHQAHK